MPLVTRARATVVALLGVAVLAQGCAPLVASGIATGAAMVSERRTAGSVLEDQRLQLRGTQQLKQVLPGTDTAYASVDAFNRRVLLTGVAPDAAAKEQAGRIAAGLENVRIVHNEIEVYNGMFLPSGVRDSGLTARVRAALMTDPKLDITSIKVTTENRTVYLMGLVTEGEGARASKHASTTSGVERVVTLFDYISDAQLAALLERRVADDAPSRQGQ